MMATGTRQTADDRREAILEIALEEFAARGLEGTSTEDIARRAGISQPYVFRLFGTKKELFMAMVECCLREELDMFREASAGVERSEVMAAIGTAYFERLADRNRLRGQMQAYVACDDPEVCDVVRKGFGELVTFVEAASGGTPEEVANFFAKGMLLNVVATMDLLHADESWAKRLLEGCGKE